MIGQPNTVGLTGLCVYIYDWSVCMIGQPNTIGLTGLYNITGQAN